MGHCKNCNGFVRKGLGTAATVCPGCGHEERIADLEAQLAEVQAEKVEAERDRDQWRHWRAEDVATLRGKLAEAQATVAHQARQEIAEIANGHTPNVDHPIFDAIAVLQAFKGALWKERDALQATLAEMRAAHLAYTQRNVALQKIIEEKQAMLEQAREALPTLKVYQMPCRENGWHYLFSVEPYEWDRWRTALDVGKEAGGWHFRIGGDRGLADTAALKMKGQEVQQGTRGTPPSRRRRRRAAKRCVSGAASVIPHKRIAMDVGGITSRIKPMRRGNNPVKPPLSERSHDPHRSGVVADAGGPGEGDAGAVGK